MTQFTGPSSSGLLGPATALDASGGARPANRATAAMLLADLSQLTKPRITLMVLVTTSLGFAMATAGSAWSDLPRLLSTLVGTALSCMSANVLNQVIERDVDGLMRRTANRPLPRGRMAPVTAMLLGLALAAAGVGLLAAGCSPLAGALAAFTVVSYVLVYTPLKRVTTVSTIMGAMPGALPPVIGYAAAADRVGPAALAMFAILFLWQLPHFLAIAWLYRDEYARAGMVMLPVVDPTGASTFRQILLGCLALLPLGLLPTMMGISGPIYFVGASLAGAGFLAMGIWLSIRRTKRHARALFLASLVYLPVVFALMYVDRV